MFDPGPSGLGFYSLLADNLQNLFSIDNTSLTNNNMEKFAVFTQSTFNAVAELSISNKIVEKEDKLVVLNIIRGWVNSLFPNDHYVVYFKGNYENATIDDVEMTSMTGEPYKLIIVRAPHNVRVRIGTFRNAYTIKKV